MIELADEATKAVIVGLGKEVVSEAFTAGKRVITWLRGKPRGNDAIAKLKANPSSEAAKLDVKTAITYALEADPAGALELRELLGPVTIHAPQGATNVRGPVTQVQGNNNRIGG